MIIIIFKATSLGSRHRVGEVITGGKKANNTEEFRET